jgi:hypothetical protein
MTTIRFSGKTAGLRRVLLHAALFAAVTTVGFAGMLTIDRQEGLSTQTYSTYAECSHGAGPVALSVVSPDRQEPDSRTDGCFGQLLKFFHLSGVGGSDDDMAAILRE